jgi:hypothetical protein
MGCGQPGCLPVAQFVAALGILQVGCCRLAVIARFAEITRQVCNACSTVGVVLIAIVHESYYEEAGKHRLEAIA